MKIDEYAKACDQMRAIIKDPETKTVGRVYMELAYTSEFWQRMAMKYRELILKAKPGTIYFESNLYVDERKQLLALTIEDFER